MNIIFDKKIDIIVKPNSSSNKIIGYDKDRESYRVEISANAQDNKANKEIIKFFSKLSKKKVSIVKGIISRKKTLKFE